MDDIMGQKPEIELISLSSNLFGFQASLVEENLENFKEGDEILSEEFVEENLKFLEEDVDILPADKTPTAQTKNYAQVIVIDLTNTNFS